MSWTENDELTEVSDMDNRPILGVTGGDRVRVGDEYVLTFEDDGEEIDTKQGLRAAFDAVLEEATFAPVNGDGDDIPEGSEVRFMTGSSRFLSELAPHMPVAGKTFRVTIDGTGYDSAYTIEAEE